MAKIKETIQEQHSFEVAQQKLIAYGKVLDDDNKLAKDYNLKEGDFVVIMITKVR